MKVIIASKLKGTFKLQWLILGLYLRKFDLSVGGLGYLRHGSDKAAHNVSFSWPW